MIKRFIIVFFLSSIHWAKTDEVIDQDTIFPETKTLLVEQKVLHDIPQPTKLLLKSQYPNRHTGTHIYRNLSLMILSVWAMLNINYIRTIRVTRDFKNIILFTLVALSAFLGSLVADELVNLVRLEGYPGSQDFYIELLTIPFAIMTLGGILYVGYLAVQNTHYFTELPFIKGKNIALKLLGFISISMIAKLSFDLSEKMILVSEEDLYQAEDSATQLEVRGNIITTQKIYTRSWRFLIPLLFLSLFLAREAINQTLFINYTHNILISVVTLLEIGIIHYIAHFSINTPDRKKIEYAFFLEDSSIYATISATIYIVVGLFMMSISSIPYLQNMNINIVDWAKSHALAWISSNILDGIIQLLVRKQRKIAIGSKKKPNIIY